MVKVAVDIDDSLYDFNSLAQEMMIDIALDRGDKSFQAGAYSTWHEWRTPNDMLEADWQTVIDMCHQDQVIRRQTPFTHAAETLHRINECGNQIMYISNRSPETADATETWLYENNFPQAESLVCTTESKAPFLQDCQYLIDDRPKTLVEFVYDAEWKDHSFYDRIGFGLFCEYNRALTDIPGIYLAPNWVLLEKYIEEKSDLFEPSRRNRTSHSLSI